MRFDELEKIAFDKEAGIISTPFHIMSSLGGPLASALKAGTTGVGLLGRGAWAAAKPVRVAGNAVMNVGNAALMQGGKALGGAALGGLSGLAGTAVGLGRAGLEGVALPVARAAARRFGRAPISTSLGALGAYGSAQSLKPILAGEAYDMHRMNPYLSTSPAGFGVEKYNPFSKLGESRMSNAPSFSQLEKVAGNFYDAKGKNVSEKFLFPLAAGIAAGIATPILQNMGQILGRKIFSPESLAGTDEIKAKTMAEYEGKELVKNKEKAKKEREVRPAMSAVFDALKKQDHTIAEAYKDPKLKNVLHNTLETVYAFAPDVARDHRTMQSVLREAITAPEGGLSFQTAKQLAETQKFISEARGGKR